MNIQDAIEAALADIPARLKLIAGYIPFGGKFNISMDGDAYRIRGEMPANISTNIGGVPITTAKEINFIISPVKIDGTSPVTIEFQSPHPIAQPRLLDFWRIDSRIERIVPDGDSVKVSGHTVSSGIAFERRLKVQWE